MTWTGAEGWRHETVDDGESDPASFKKTPVLARDGAFPAPEVARRFAAAAAGLPPGVAAFVLERLEAYPSGPAATASSSSS